MTDATALRLANAWQRGFPLLPRPFREIGARAGLSEEEVLEKYESLRRDGVIDRIGPVFRPNTVGASTLAAMEVPPARLEEAAAQVSSFPGVNHNYEREHRWNLWFVATGASDAEVQETLARIEQAAGLRALRLPLLEEFHIDLGFDLESGAAPRSARPASGTGISSLERRFAARVAAGLPLVPRPYAALGVGEDAAIATLGRWLDGGIVRRIGAVVRHRHLGYEANAMVVWDVPDAQAAEFGGRLAADDAVTLCYRRERALPDWPYNLYCMIHGRTRSRATREIERLSATAGLQRFPRATLFSRRCFAQRAACYG